MARNTIAAMAGAFAITLSALAAPIPALSAEEAVVYRHPTCGCCGGWVDHLKSHGYKVTVINREDVETVKDRLGVPADLRSCHTAKIGGYLVEGHVPMAAVDKLLAEKPRVAGIASPGMPMGSPGMEMPAGARDPNPVYSFGEKGTVLFMADEAAR